jgi:hypothetical protein
MHALNLYRYRYKEPRNGKWCTTRYVLTEEEAAKRFPDGERLDYTLEVRQVPEADESEATIAEAESNEEARLEREAIQADNLQPEENYADSADFESIEPDAQAAAGSDTHSAEQAIGENAADLAQVAEKPAGGTQNAATKELSLANQSPADLAAKVARESDQAAEDKRRADLASTVPLALTPSGGSAARPAVSSVQDDLFSQPANTLSPADLLRAAAAMMDDVLAEQQHTPAPQSDLLGGDANTEDAGAELAYNRRNRIKTGIKWDDIADKNEALRVSETTKQNVYPKPNYEALIADGVDPMIAHLVKQAYDSLAAKPATRSAPTDADLKLYIEGVNRYMTGVLAWANDKDALGQWAKGQSRIAGAMTGKVTSLADLTDKPVKSLVDMVYPGGWREFRPEISIIGGNKAFGKLQPGYDEVTRAIKAGKEGWPAARGKPT